ncbi:GMC family oxidoreductase [Aspergillus lucknowensis]|uniref:glucose oxidase n=1 Tax=Aspergillus lucknowensis TaxID=176173 RepID=A0ABR4LXZ0_9EURO
MALSQKALALACSICALVSLGTAASVPDHFDFIIIGGGTTGLAVANRLSEVPDITVAVIEAGKDEGKNPNVTSVEGFGGSTGVNTQIDWLYATTEQTHAGGRVLDYHAGKAWGGTSTINGMTYIRAEDAQIDAWERVGNDGWNWENLWPYHLKSEHFETPTQAQLAAGASYEDVYHGRNGPLSVAYQYGLHNGSFASLVNETWQQFGIPLNEDVNGGSLRGFFVWPQTLDREANVREHAARAYYYPVQDRSNLVLLRGHVDRIRWAEGNATKALAEGVEYTAPDGSVKALYADKEVILSAGSVRSPAILELSGVGNPEILESLNIPVKVPLPAVGENAIDQPNTFMTYTSNSTFTGMVPYVTYMTASDILGSETDAVAGEIAAQLKPWAQQVAEESNNALSASAIEHLYQVQHDLIFTQDVPCVEILTTAMGGNVGSAFFALLPFSRGRVHISSANPAAYPALDPNYLMAYWDLVLQRTIAQTVAKFWETAPVNSVAGARAQPPVSDLPANATDEEWDAWVASSFTANHHLLGTAAMLPEELGGVVDPTLVVYGTENVRVIDASVLPAQISGHLTSILYAVAERAADIIKENLGKQRDT